MEAQWLSSGWNEKQRQRLKVSRPRPGKFRAKVCTRLPQDLQMTERPQRRRCQSRLHVALRCTPAATTRQAPAHHLQAPEDVAVSGARRWVRPLEVGGLGQRQRRIRQAVIFQEQSCQHRRYQSRNYSQGQHNCHSAARGLSARRSWGRSVRTSALYGGAARAGRRPRGAALIRLAASAPPWSLLCVGSLGKCNAEELS